MPQQHEHDPKTQFMSRATESTESTARPSTAGPWDSPLVYRQHCHRLRYWVVLLVTGATLGCSDPVEYEYRNTSTSVLVATHAEKSTESVEVRSASRAHAEVSPAEPTPQTRPNEGAPESSHPLRLSRPTALSSGRPPMLAIRTVDTQFLGLPIGLFLDKTLLMCPNGCIEYVDNSDIVSQRITTRPFEPQAVMGLTTELQAEFGPEYRVRNASPYLIVARPDRIRTWGDRFQRFHQSIRLFGQTHGLTMRAADFPLVAVVLGSHREFEQYARLDGSNLPDTCLGYYSQRTNRVVMYDDPRSQASDQVLETICHEATHQLAFNTGMHQRLAETPLWVAEGFAVQFEAPAYCNYAQRDRTTHWPTSQRNAWEQLKSDPRRLEQLLESIVRSDLKFETDTLDAYTAAWALSSYLSQRRSRQYVAYIQRIGQLEPFQTYSAGDRLRDFVAVFGSELPIIVRQTIAHIDGLR